MNQDAKPDLYGVYVVIFDYFPLAVEHPHPIADPSNADKLTSAVGPVKSSLQRLFSVFFSVRSRSLQTSVGPPNASDCGLAI